VTRQNTLLLALGAAVVLYFLARSEKGSTFATDILTNATRSIRNHNPGNIRLSPRKWQGQVPASEQKDKSFVQFTAPEFGIRAMAKVLKSYMGRGLITIEKIISTWAPATENDTRAYVLSVAKQANLSPTEPLTQTQVMKLIPAIIKHENGAQPYSLDTINKGISLA
jgi:hypothetical protein